MKDNKLSLTDTADVAELQKKIAELINENKSLKKQKKFGLVWEDKPDAQVLRVRNEAPMLCEDTSKAVISDTNDTNHILINGDNFHALTALRATHMGKVDVIYIDPPYNTGNKDFIYNDDFIDKENGYRHSKWLSFMEKRLSLARELLTDTGVIFVSIDDNEQARLKLLMDDVFKPENFIANICVKSRASISNDKIISTSHNSLLFFAKNVKSVESIRHLYGLNPKLDGFNLEDENGQYKLVPVDGPGGASKGNPFYEFMGVAGYWRFSKETMQAKYNEGLIVVRNNSLQQKYYLSSAINKRRTDNTWWDDKMQTSAGTSLLSSILGKDSFNNPKPIALVSRVVELAAWKKNAIILDFFAGSGTTAHAVAELNKSDGGVRQCILVTDGGKTETTGESSKNAKGDITNIAEEITYERIRRVLTGKDWADGKEHDPLGGNLRYFKVAMEKSPHGATERDQRLTLEKYTIEHAKIAENIFDLIVSKDDFDDETLTAIDYKVFAAGTDNRYLVGVNSHDYLLSELEAWFISLPMEAKLIMVGKGIDEIKWVKNNSNRIKVDDILGRAIRSRKYVASKLPLE